MKRIVEKLDVVRPYIRGKFVQPAYITSKVTICQKAECAGHLDGIIEAPGRNIGLPDHGDTRVAASNDFTFHRSERYRLMPADHLGLLVAGWKGNEKRRDEPSERSRTQIKLGLDGMELPWHI